MFFDIMILLTESTNQFWNYWSWISRLLTNYLENLFACLLCFFLKKSGCLVKFIKFIDLDICNYWIRWARWIKFICAKEHSREEMRGSSSIGNRPHPPAPITVFWPFLAIFVPTICYLSQNWDSDNHFEVLNGSKSLLV